MLAHHRRLFAAAFSLLVAVGVLVPAAAAGAADTGYELTAGWFVLGAKAACPGTPARDLTDKKAAAFIESWYPASILGTLPEEKPPAGLPRCTFVGQSRINNERFQFRALYVAQGKKAWVGLPVQVLGPGAYVPEAKWYIASKRMKDGYFGRIDPLPREVPTTTTTPPADITEDESSGSATPWIIAGIAGVVILGAGAVLVRSRARGGRSSVKPS